MKSNCLNFILVLPVLLQTFLIFQNEGKTIDFTDTWHQFSDCFFTIVCELDEGHSIPPPMALGSIKSLEYLCDLIPKLLPQVVSFTAADLVSETFWKTKAKHILCNLTEAEREKLENDFGADVMHYLSEVCINPLRKEECEKSEAASLKYMETYEEKLGKGECESADEMLPIN